MNNGAQQWISVCNWTEYQHYLDGSRRMLWFKLHTKLWRNPNFRALNESYRYRLISLFAVAAECDNKILNDLRYLKACMDIRGSLDLQVLSHFIEPWDASNVLADCYPRKEEKRGDLEKKRKEESGTGRTGSDSALHFKESGLESNQPEAPARNADGTAGKPDAPAHESKNGSKKGRGTATPQQIAPLPDAPEIQSCWNEVAGRTGLISTIRSWTPQRKSTAAARLKDEFWRDNWYEALERIEHCHYIKIGGQDGNWKPDVDWFLRPATVVQLMEGKYGYGHKAAKGSYNQPEVEF